MRRHTVRDVMTNGAICQSSPDTSVREAIRLMSARNVGSVLVADSGCLLGIFTERDALRRVLAIGRDPDRTALAEVMTREPDTIRSGASIDDAIRCMDEFGYRHLPVVDDGAVVGVLSIRDCSIGDLAAMCVELEERHVFAERAW